MSGRIYMADSGLISIAATGATPALYFSTPATADLTLLRMKPSIEVSSTATPAPPSNSNLFFSLNKVTGTVAGGAAITPSQVQGNALAANSTWKSGSTALTGLTQGTEYWPSTIPFTAGASFQEDDENTNSMEIPIAVSSTYAFYFSVPSGPGVGTGMFARICAWFLE